MTTIDLSAPPPAPTDLLDALPRRVALTLPELRFVAAKAGGAPLPFDVAEPASAGALDSRLGESRGSAEDAAYASALASLHDPATSLSRRGLLLGGPDDGVVDGGLVGAVGLLATPTVAVDLDLAAGGVQAKAWHRQAGAAVATLSTVDGLVFELAWFPTDHWSAELARVAVHPRGPRPAPLRGARDGRPALRAGRRRRRGAAHGARRRGARARRPAHRPRHRAAGPGPHRRRHRRRAGRARRARPGAGCAPWSPTSPVSGPPSSGSCPGRCWRTAGTRCGPHQDGDELRVEVRRVDAADLAAELAPVLAEVTA